MQGTPLHFPREIADRYTVARELGRGGTAIVYLANDRVTGTQVVLKVLRAELAESLSADRFLREIQLTAQLSHPNIAPVLDSGAEDGWLYCVLPFMSGGTLRARLDRERQLPLAEVAAIARGVGHALTYAHARGVIHRDVKPENILFADGAARLADFGIAKAMERASDTTTTTGVVRGTPAYMSPEQASGERECDGRSDAYSLACVLYEAIAGMAAFVGPSAQAVLAQRLMHVPRPVGVYRPGVSGELERVLARELAVAPADRYQTVTAFTDALCRAIDAPAATQSGRPPRGRQWAWVAALAVVAGIAFFRTGARQRAMSWMRPVPLDTTTIAILPMPGAPPGEDPLAAGFRPWRGVTLADQRAVAEAVRRHTGLIDIGGAAVIARQAHAGRYVMGQLDSSGAGKTLSATLYDAQQHPLYQAHLVLGSGTATPQDYAELADSLLLRGEPDDAPDPLRPGSRHLAATQLMVQGQRAVTDWNLVAADSLFAGAARFDTASGRPLVWLSQVRTWQPAAAWVPAAQTALAKIASLAPVERAMVQGLVALGSGAYPEACRTYEAMVAHDPRSFAGWYGVGECNRMDSVVVADRSSPSGWRYRSSYQRALVAYVAAFKLRAASYRGFQANGYERLRDLLFLDARTVRPGASGDRDSNLQFYGVRIVAHDTVVFVPVPAVAFRAGVPAVTVAQLDAATEHLRRLFQTITASWALAAPESPGAKEAVAIGLEIEGDPAAADSLAVAQHLSTDPLQRLYLAAMRAYVLFNVGVPESEAPGDSAALARAAQLADSLFQSNAAATGTAADLLAPVAAMTGRCRTAATLLRRGTQDAAGDPDVPPYVAADARALLAYAAMGCAVPPALPSVDALAARLTTPATADSTRRAREYEVLGGIVRSRFPLDSPWIARFAPTSDFLITAERDWLRHDTSAVRARLRRLISMRAGSAPGDVTADAVLPEARLWLALGDTAGAIVVLKSALDFARNDPPLSPSEASQSVVIFGARVQAMALRAELAGADPRTARRWSDVVRVLWRTADPELQPLVRRLQALGRQ